MFVHHLDPVFLHLGPFSIRYYGIAYAAGFLFAYFFLHRAMKNHSLALSPALLDSLLLRLIIGVVAGARLGHILFYQPSYYFHHPLAIFFIWQGGLSFHGGLIGGVAALLLFCARTNISFLSLADVLVLPASLALGFGRIANFINGELYGIPTTLPWGVQFPGTSEFRHPTQLYEALKNFMIFFSLLALRKKSLPEGTLFAWFLILYGTLRFFIEFLKDLPSVLGPFTMGQILSLLMIPFGILLLRKRSASK